MAQNFYDAAREFVTIYSPSGVAESVTRLNAHDLVRTNGYQWFNAPVDAPVEPVVDVLAGLETLADRSAIAEAAALAEANPAKETAEADVVKEPVDKADDEDTLTEKSPIDADQNKLPLAELALAVTGNSDVAAYLKAFSAEALRTLAAERYDAAIHHRTSLDNIIAKIVELEAAKTAKESDQV